MALSPKFIHFNFSVRILWDIESNAFKESMKAAEINLFESMSLSLCSVAHNKASVADNLSRKPNCEGLKRLCFYKKRCLSYFKTFPKIFDNGQVIQIGLYLLGSSEFPFFRQKVTWLRFKCSEKIPLMMTALVRKQRSSPRTFEQSFRAHAGMLDGLIGFRMLSPFSNIFTIKWLMEWKLKTSSLNSFSDDLSFIDDFPKYSSNLENR